MRVGAACRWRTSTGRVWYGRWIQTDDSPTRLALLQSRLDKNENTNQLFLFYKEEWAPPRRRGLLQTIIGARNMLMKMLVVSSQRTLPAQTSSSLSSMLGIEFATGKRLPLSGQMRAPLAKPHFEQRVVHEPQERLVEAGSLRLRDLAGSASTPSTPICRAASTNGPHSSLGSVRTMNSGLNSVSETCTAPSTKFPVSGSRAISICKG